MAPTRIRFWKKDFTRELKVAVKDSDSTTKRDTYGNFAVARQDLLSWADILARLAAAATTPGEPVSCPENREHAGIIDGDASCMSRRQFIVWQLPDKEKRYAMILYPPPQFAIFL
jgi:hypothetical protein